MKNKKHNIIKIIKLCPYCGTPDCGTKKQDGKIILGIACQKIIDLEAWKEQAINAYPHLENMHV